MKEIGGYIELDSYCLPMLHEKAIALNCGRNALAYLFKAKSIHRILIPRFLCSSVPNVCKRENVAYSYYEIGADLLPAQDLILGNDEWLYLVNYYSQLTNEQIAVCAAKYKRIIVDNVQSYFQAPVPGVDTLYTCRKYFGVADGAFLYTDAVLNEELPVDESFERMRFLLGRYERSAGEFYGEYVANNKLFASEPVKRMSKLTRNLLHGIDYERVRAIREENYLFLHKAFGGINGLPLSDRPGTFMYPLLLENGAEVRKRLQEKKIYIPTLWPDVFGWCGEGDTEYQMAMNILPLPIDQRYGTEELRYMTKEIEKCTNL